ncbi:MAG: hypothetical protein OQK45_00130 [Sulfurovum sp.]|nr:hypothetical protein [Sulfurovum sp.]
MKKLMSLVFSGVVALVLSGCGGGGSNYNDGLTTLFLVDEQGFAYADIPYQCYDQGVLTYSDSTLNNGEFSFYPGEDCKFDFLGYDGVYGDVFDEIIRIVDYTYDGKGDIPYQCDSFGIGSTYTDGSFDYDADDACVFYL